MKKGIALSLLILLSTLTFAQKWLPYKVDDSIEVLLPKGFQKKDTLNQQIITGTTSFGTVMIIIAPDNKRTTPDIEKKKHLDRYYDDYIKKVSAAANGTISDEKDTLLGQLRIKDFTLALDSGSGKQIRNFRILHENGNTYSFEFLWEDIHKEYAPAERDKFFSSIKLLANANLETQFTDPSQTTGKAPPGNRTGYIIGSISALIVIVVLFLVFRRKR
jgi:hypothetical protein